jgi:short-subunit dehydrogenase
VGPKLKKVVLITGTSSGIGAALAKLLWRSDFNVVATSRKESLSRLADYDLTEHESFHVRPMDVTNSTERKLLVDEINDRWGGVDILVNNAGISYRSVIEHMTEQEELRQQQVNFIGPMELTKLVLPQMRKQRWGRIINVSSVGGMMAMPTMGSYSASKFALEGASEALSYELKPWNIKVALVRPGFVHSDSYKHVVLSEHGKLSVNDERSDYHNYYRYMACFVERLMSRTWATPESVAKRIEAVILAADPPLRVAGTSDAYLFGMLRRMLPQRLYHYLLYRNLPNIDTWVKDVKN